MDPGSHSKPLLVFDGDCGFCRSWVGYWRAFSGDRVEYQPYQSVAENFPSIPVKQFSQAVHLILPDGQYFSGAEAVFQLMAITPGHGAALFLYDRLPGFAAVCEAGYQWVAAHRSFSEKLLKLVWGPYLFPQTYAVARWVFLRFLAIVYFFAFLSAFSQIQGLVGAQGILPFHRLMSAAQQALGPERYRLLPTLAWFNSSDAFLRFLAGGGAVFSLLLLIGVAEGPLLLVLWAFYLSLVTAGQDFFAFQWDSLLLEAGLLAIFWAPWRALAPPWRSAAATPPSRTGLWLLRWLLFRLMFLSGCVKLISHDPNWRNLTALEFHYWTQPLPSPLSWYAALLPGWFQRLSAAGVFAIELGAPFLIFAPRRLRLAGCCCLMGLQFLIAATGNFAFFNLLSVSLCLLLIDDSVWRRLLPAFLLRQIPQPVLSLPSPAFRRWAAAALATFILLLSGSAMLRVLAGPGAVTGPLAALDALQDPFRIVNNYGLFAIMTTNRLEIIPQGSDDGIHWLDYGFRFKPAGLQQAPRWIAPYQPRLDWQMWFAALSSFRQNPWFVNFMVRLMQGSPPVLHLMGSNPFPDHPPRYVRAIIYSYRFTTPAERKATGRWWSRKLQGLYFPAIKLK